MSGKYHHRVINTTHNNYPLFMYREELQQIGLSKNEAKIYEALVGLGQASISSIASAGKVNRRNVYDSIKNLQKKDLIIRIRGSQQHLYKAAEPKKLQHMLNMQKQDIISIIPDLNKLYNQHVPEEQAFISRGHEGIKNFWKYAGSQSEILRFVGGKGAWHDKKINEERKHYFKDFKNKGIKIQGIFDYEMIEHGKDIYSQYDLNQIRFFTKEYSTKAAFDLCGNRVVLFNMPKERSVENVTVFNIISRPLADSYQKWFNNLWKEAKELDFFKN